MGARPVSVTFRRRIVSATTWVWGRNSALDSDVAETREMQTRLDGYLTLDLETAFGIIAKSKKAGRASRIFTCLRSDETTTRQNSGHTQRVCEISRIEARGTCVIRL